MKITLFTSNNIRHDYLINLFSKISSKLFVVKECKSLSSVNLEENLENLNITNRYFRSVNIAQRKLFGLPYIDILNKNVEIISLPLGGLNTYPIMDHTDFLDSDIYVAFGCSYIKGELVDFLINNKTINIHMGVSPYYRGSGCNFWALYDDNPHLVGATIHQLSKGLDNGPILYHAMSKTKDNPFDYTMSTVKSAFHSIAERIKDKSIFNIEPIAQDKSKEIRRDYTKIF